MSKKDVTPAQDKINWDEVHKLCSYQCTQEEIAAWFGVSLQTLERACIRDMQETLGEFWQKKRNSGRVKLRKAQMAIVERGGPGAATMAIYLDKKMFPDENPNRPPVPDLSQQNAVPNLAQEKKIFTFVEFCINAGYPAPVEKQEKEMLSFLRETVTRLLLGSRGYGKTDYITILGVAYEIYLNYMAGLHTDKTTACTNLIITKSKSRNTAIVEEIAHALKANGVLLEKENTTNIRVKGLIGKDDSVEAITIRTSMRGRHPFRTIMDDPVTEEDVSQAMRILVKRKYNEAMKLCSNILVIGQPAHAYDLYAELRGIVKKLELPYGSIPELDHDLEAQRMAGVDESSIQASYFLKINADGSMPFQNIKYADVFPIGADKSVAFIDPSEGGDYTAVSVIKIIVNGVFVQGHQWKRAWYHCADDMVKVFKDLNVGRVCFETNKFGSQPVAQLRQILEPLGIGVVGKASDSNKHACIMSAGSYSHLIHLSRKSDQSYTNHVVQYEHDAEFDDAPDSLARGLEWIGLIKGKK